MIIDKAKQNKPNNQEKVSTIKSDNTQVQEEMSLKGGQSPFYASSILYLSLTNLHLSMSKASIPT